MTMATDYRARLTQSMTRQRVNELQKEYEYDADQTADAVLRAVLSESEYGHMSVAVTEEAIEFVKDRYLLGR